MPKLSDTQLVILSAASQRPDRLVLPLPDRLKGGAAAKVVDALLAKGLIEEIQAGPDQPVWREADDGSRLTLVVTDAAIEALGIEANEAPTAAEESVDHEPAEAKAVPQESRPVQANATPARRTREGSKQAELIAMLKRPEGASIEEIVAAFGWQAHTVRGAIAGALKKKLGLDVTSEKVDGRGRVYRIA
jgi:hypothetical protein